VVDEPVPAPLRAAVVLIAAEAAAAAVVAAILAYQDLTGDATNLAGAVAVTAFAAGYAAVLAALARALHRRRGGARGITIVFQLMLLPIGYYATTGGQGWAGVPVIVVALAICGLLITPASTRALGLADRGRRGAD
jgi:hypothetical protein